MIELFINVPGKTFRISVIMNEEQIGLYKVEVNTCVSIWFDNVPGRSWKDSP